MKSEILLKSVKFFEILKSNFLLAQFLKVLNKNGKIKKSPKKLQDGH